MHGVKQIHRDRYARCLQSILINCVTAEKKNNLLTTVATKSTGLTNLSARFRLMVHKDIRIEQTDNIFTVILPLT